MLIPAVGGPGGAGKPAPLGIAAPGAGREGGRESPPPVAPPRRRRSSAAAARPATPPPGTGIATPPVRRPPPGPVARREAQGEEPPRRGDRGGQGDARAAQAGGAADEPAAIARSPSTRSRGPRSGSTARTRPSTRRSSTTSFPAASTSWRSSAPTCRSTRPRASTFARAEVQAALHAGHRGLSRARRRVAREPTNPPQASARTSARPRSRAVAAEALEAAWRDVLPRGRVKRRAHPAARDFLHDDLTAGARPARSPPTRRCWRSGCGEGDLLAALPNARRTGIDYLPEMVARGARPPPRHRLRGRRRHRAAGRPHRVCRAGLWDAVDLRSALPQRARHPGAAGRAASAGWRPTGGST